MKELINITYLLIVILVPIIPAFLLFKKLKSSAEASGPISPIKEFTVKFGGAFAGYFPIFLLLYFKLPHQFSQENDVDNLWEVKGNVLDATTRSKIKSNQADLQVVLEPYSKVKGGVFTIYLPSSIINGKEKLDYRLQVEDNKEVYLSSNELNLDDLKDQFKKTRVIQLPDSALMLNKKDIVSVDTLSVQPVTESPN
jgi:hypothetical protein